MTCSTPLADTTNPPGLELGALSRWFGANVPACQGPLAAAVLHGGRSNLTYLVTDGHSRWVVRRPPLGGLTPSAHDIGREFRVMSALRATGVAVPGTVAHCTDQDVTGAPFTVVAYVEGRVLRSRADTAGLTPYDLGRCADGLVEQLARLHALSYTEAGLSGWGRPEGYLRRQLDRWRTQWDLVATRQLSELPRLHKALEDALPRESDASIVHGDFRVDNTILDPTDLSRVRAVVDWELSTLGDPLADLGTFLAYRDPAVDALLDSPAATDPGFPGPFELAELYALLSGRDITLLPFYQALAYFKIAVIAEGVYARHLQGVTVGEGFAGAGASVPELVKAGLALLGRRR
ncbi:putative acyl-CoA dehydrogenase [Streptomyces bingchenggensis BCW-1]|uniref:Putative acyl-CoA dehydrogenase n=1 Tax=Streptomyces bingchenggensis (strain BCW-1) TaxID=749414 RepID=D7BW65_STRBB|nr:MULTISPECIES: phosphotransferase family protein [Streptomyces]ADI11775.1 putative acyl-CoA dehydrogenase [Streptomyces bingchenggensis BCW-1]